MGHFKTLTFLFLIILFSGGIQAQVVWTEPAFPTQDDLVTLYYNVSEGNEALLDVNEPCPGCPFVFAHWAWDLAHVQSGDKDATLN